MVKVCVLNKIRYCIEFTSEPSVEDVQAASGRMKIACTGTWRVKNGMMVLSTLNPRTA